MTIQMKMRMLRMRLSDREQEVVIRRPRTASGPALRHTMLLLGLMLVAQVRWAAAENQSVAGTSPRSTLVGAQAEQLGPVTQAVADHLSTAAPAVGQQQVPSNQPEKQPPQTSESSSDKKAQLGAPSGGGGGSAASDGGQVKEPADGADKAAGKSVGGKPLEQHQTAPKKSRKPQSNKKQQMDEERSSTNRVVSYADSPGSTGAHWQLLDHQGSSSPPHSKQSPVVDREQKNQRQQSPRSHRASSESGSNRWTHFGARLKPLAGGSGSAPTPGPTAAAAQPLATTPATGPADHTESASTHAKSHSAYYVPHASTPASSVHRGRQVAAPASTEQSQPDSADSGEPDADQDDQADNEALLYKMMMQQPSNMLSDQDDDNQAPKRRGGPRNQARRIAQSDRVMKLLKSYSHIHQVDDSDDQIRGSSPESRLQQQQARRAPAAQQVSASGHDDGSWRGGDWRQQQAAANRQQRQQALERSSHNENSPPEVEDDGSYNPSQDEAPAGGQQQSAGSAEQAASAPEDEFECPNNGIFADEPSGCQYYHVCQSGAQVQQKFQCPLGTLFNNLILTCDFAHNVHCGKPAKKRPALPEHPSYQTGWRDENRAPARSNARVAPTQEEPRTLKVGHAAPSARRYQQVQPAAAPVANEIDGPDDEGSEEAEEEAPPAKPPQVPPTPPQIRRQFVYQTNPQDQYKRLTEQQSYMNRQVEFDGASVTTPVFASREESSPPANAVGPSAVLLPLKPAVMDDNSFNLVINHLTTQHKPQSPMRVQQYQQQRPQPHLQQQQQQQQQQYQLSQVTNPSQPMKAPQDNTQNQREPNYASIPRQQVAPSRRPPAAPHQSGSHARQQVRQAAGSNRFVAQPEQNNRQYQQHLVASSGRQEPSLIDLTNDRRQQVSSAALNDGLVLLVRHDTAPAPVFKAARHAPHQQLTTAASTTGPGRAFAIDPSAIRPDSVLDSQLFPNVQSALIPGKAAQVSQRMVAAHLPRVEPPKAQHQFSARPHYTAASNQLAQIAPAPGVVPTGTRQATPHQRVRRAKKVVQLSGASQENGKPVNPSIANNTTATTSDASSQALSTPVPQLLTTTPVTNSFTPIQKRINKTSVPPKESSSSLSSLNLN